MVHVHRFAAVRPKSDLAGAVAAVPYDVVTTGEAEEAIASNPLSFLRVSRSDALLPDIPPQDDRVYARAREEFQAMQDNGVLFREEQPFMYLYRVTSGDERFSGLCCCVDAADYRENHIRRHELTRYDKEEDRTRHIGDVRSHNGQVVLLYPDHEDLYAYLDALFPPGSTPDCVVKNGHGSIHEVFTIRDEAALNRIEESFSKISDLYIADGHHRAKSSVNVADRMISSGTCPVEAGRFMAVVFGSAHVRIHGYSRLLADLGGRTPAEFLAELKRSFSVRTYGPVDDVSFQVMPLGDQSADHIFHLYLAGTWYELSTPRLPGRGVIESLDVSILQHEVFSRLLGIADPRGDPRLQYLGGARPLADLVAKVDGGAYRAAIAMQPVKVGEVIAIADAGSIMPPKSTWFEPKLLSGLLIHTF